jgi:hypothetical protein
MTKLNRDNSHTTSDDKGQKVRSRASRNVVRETPTIVLKTLHDDIMRDNANATITTKHMRVWLRANMRDVHAHNASWIFTQSQYDVVRSHFDAKYRAKIERATKRDANVKRVTKSRVVASTTTNDVVANNANVDDNANA